MSYVMGNGLGHGVHEILVQGKQDGQMILNGFHYRFVPALGEAALINTPTLDAFIVRWRAQILPLLSSSYSVLYYIMREIGSATTNPHRFHYVKQDLINGDTPDVGGVDETALPALSSVSVQFFSALLARSRRGGKRFSGIPETQSDADLPNYLSGLAVADWNDATIALRAPLVPIGQGVDARLCIASPLLADGVNVYDPAFLDLWTTQVTDSKVNTRITSQVSRKPRSDVF